MYRLPAISILLLFGALSCAGGSPRNFPLYRSPLLAGSWAARPPRLPENGSQQNASDNDTKEPTNSAVDSIRKRLVAGAEELLKKRDSAIGFGWQDLASILKQMGRSDIINGERSLPAFAESAKSVGAYSSDDDPSPGDIVLFHNQRDVNGNGGNDDWYTGAGVVISRTRGSFSAVTRTGNKPRIVVTTPKYPSGRKSGSKQTNCFVRTPQRFDPSDTYYLSGRLYAGYIDVEKLSEVRASDR